MSVSQLVRKSIEHMYVHIMINGIMWSGKRKIKKDNDKFYKKKKCNHKKVHVVANGPSVNDTLAQIGEFEDVITVNFSLRDERIAQLHPKIHVLIDPRFVEQSDYLHQLNDYKKRNIVGKIVVTQAIKKAWIRNIGDASNLVVLNTATYSDEYRSGRDKKCYENNYLAPYMQTVAIAAVYVAIQEGYSDIYLHGCDITWMQDLTVRDDNIVYRAENHFYGAEKMYVPTKFSMLELTRSFYIAFLGFCQLKCYAADEGVDIYNMSKSSMLDMFERK